MVLQNMKTVTKIFLLFLLANSINCFSQSKIDRSKKDLTSPSRTDNNNKDNERDSNSSSHVSFDNEFRNILFQGFMYLTYYSIIGNFDAENHLHNNLSNYPYDGNLSGNFENSVPVSPPINYLRIDLENQLLLSQNNLYGNHLKVKIRPYQYFYIQTDLHTLIEYNRAEKNYTNLSLLNINIGYDRIRFDRFNLGWTLGINYIGNDIKKAGFSYGLNTDVFISKPYSLYSSVKWSSINNAPVNEFELKCRYHKKNFFLAVGYEHLKIGLPTYDFLSIGGGLYLF
ncbi:MAG: hypothetical protein ACI9L6_000166 [Flavobacterium sp.]|jgi:hypothetical protein